MLRRSVIPILCALGPTLGACSDEPSETTMRAAALGFLNRAWEQQAATASLIGGARRIMPMPTVTSFHKLDCEVSQVAPGHVCTFEVSLDGKPPGRDKARFYKDVDGLVYMAVVGR
ncbi:hypothetical protein GGQ91_000975 [Methylobacterium fujisawaense]|uniref:Lipoprotein n=1 Tax=Methylobacterium fujisawaense TaxID=107400 RepID=A0ABR6D8D4_9HYPH|nr:hypothetical protein [Methylobacterium fujisawaense]MBA9061614.1 hypothetical protein [Methylobacterium fujisawaense]